MLERDRYLAPELEAVTRAVAAGRFAAIVRDAAGDEADNEGGAR